MNSEKRRVALVTGGATGIGAGITARLAADGFDVFVAQRTEDDARAGREHLRAVGLDERVRVGGFDVSRGAECADAVSACAATFGGLDVLVNNAAVSGAGAIAGLADCDDAHIDRLIDTNLKAPLRMAREALPRLRAAGHGVIVNIASTAAFAAQPEALSYAAAKAGLVGLTRSLGCDLAAEGIRVVCVAPGDVATGASREPRFAAKLRDVPWRKLQAPLGYSAEPADIANAVAWLVSEEARYVTGTTLVVDGALTAY